MTTSFSPRGGFSLIELLVTLAIFTIVTTLIFIGQSRFGGTVLLTNLAYDVALTIRQAQSYGISVKEVAPGSGSFTAGYGVHFGFYTGNNTETDRARTFVLYADKNNNRRYDGNDAGGCVPDSECLSVFGVGHGNVISKICAVRSGLGASEECVDPSRFGSRDVDYVDVGFKRPNPDAFIKTNLNGADSVRYRGAKVYLASPAGRVKTVEVLNTGQISIK